MLPLVLPSQDKSLVSHQENLRIRHKSTISRNQNKRTPQVFSAGSLTTTALSAVNRDFASTKSSVSNKRKELGTERKSKFSESGLTSYCHLVSVLDKGPAIISDKHSCKLSSSAASTAACNSLENVDRVTRRCPRHSACKKRNTVWPVEVDFP